MISMKDAIQQNTGLMARVAEVQNRYTPAYYREQLPELADLDVTDDQIRRASVQLYERIRQKEQCASCTGYLKCQRPVDHEGMIVVLDVQGNDEAAHGRHICSRLQKCERLEEYLLEQRWSKLLQLSGKAANDKGLTFSNFPSAQTRRHKKLCAYVHDFANNFEPGQPKSGVYIFGPPGTAKTHLMLAMVNRLEERRIPCLFIRTDAVYRNLRGMLTRKEALDTVLESYSSTPVLVIDEFAQEAATDFTVDIIFELINARYGNGLPTFATSNYSPDDIYSKASKKLGLDAKVEAIRSRLQQLMMHKYMDGEDGRRLNRPDL
ncbi:AFG1/ZapE family ATPase [Cohnella nanjingensis]|uniref:ATP-binding protein n=1 Tax=Cohnella nanjingensis TaxID=1387779 RepID=A0A7X0RT26_9BACL|nr:AFG1/ZapE family ATPase [Cohnella nanjingensis]MBB6672996.1 ATP-binding protein [Cohnella nanjingensis]